MKRKSMKKKQQSLFPCTLEELQTELKEKAMNNNPDFVMKIVETESEQRIGFYFLYTIVKPQVLYDQIISPVQKAKMTLDIQSIDHMIVLPDSKQKSNLDEIGQLLIQGSVCIYIENDQMSLLHSVPLQEHRSIERAETESLIFGPQIAFTNSIGTNLNMIRNMVDTPHLKIEKFIIGNRIPTEVQMMYMDDIANDENVIELRNRLTSLRTEDVMNSAVLSQQIEDNPYSIFPQFMVSELPDRFSYSIKEGKIGILVDNSPSGIIAPITFSSFFESTDDIYGRWIIGFFTRLMRMFAMIVSITLTPIYVAALTFHYEVIPEALLLSLGESRNRVPFPPLLETLILETMMEFIREAGARLPTKVGQTMGIVGGIVIGQAVVQAGFTSNILIILVALSALASFTTPDYVMGSSLRILRFPIIIFAGFLGFVGFFFMLAFIIIHLLRLRSLHRPYTAPIYPFRFTDFDQSQVRIPFVLNKERPVSNLPKKTERQGRNSHNHPLFKTRGKDIDE
ncbi:spore germination protein [Allobacillus halotolerans]|uniref:Spore germination protein n=1 Tax=Allobacillus halotolerans TaxID=570278 RepID=A0ABS6GNP2_9BACI|nr:spore germination protein [Allobacillus halotolerans]MBU6080734.1 spore germination protein [Allobacillus halotolerans]